MDTIRRLIATMLHRGAERDRLERSFIDWCEQSVEEDRRFGIFSLTR